MNRSDLLVTLITSLALGIGTSMLLSGPALLIPGQSTKVAVKSAGATPASSSTATSVSSTNTKTLVSRSIPASVSPTAAPTLVPLQPGMKKGEDRDSVLLLYDSTRVSDFDINFCKIAEYYGLKCKKIALDTSPLTEDSLHDSQGDFFRLMGIGAETLLASRPLLKEDQITLIKSAVETGGTNLFVGKVDSQLKPDVLAALTDGAIVGITKPPDSKFRDWSVSTAAPEITREFTGQVITHTVSQKYEYGLALGRSDSVTTLITSTNAAGTTYPVFVSFKKESGAIFVDAGEPAESLEGTQLSQLYGVSAFSKVIPLMMAVRYALGERAWHTDHKYANLTIDDPALTEPFGHLNFAALLKEMDLHNFHTTIAFVPANLYKSELAVVRLFLDNPNRYSLVQHGNNHDGYEFYKYNVSETDVITNVYQGTLEHFPARPLVDQEQDIVQGLARIEEHQRLTGIPFDKIMVFPYGTAPEQTQVLLKKYNYWATTNAQDVPLDAVQPSRWDYGMYPALMDYADFTSLPRKHPSTYNPFRPDPLPFVFDLFLGKPALFYSHENQLFSFGMDAFDLVADAINRLTGEVEWRNLGYIVKHLYLERTSADGSVDIEMYGNDLIVANDDEHARVYHLAKQETLNVPISRVTVNGHDFPYRIESDQLLLDAIVPAHSSMEVNIRYGAPSPALQTQAQPATETHAAPAPTTPPTATPTMVTYKVQSGDTLTSIARKYGTTVKALVDANNLASQDAILRNGQELKIAGGPTVTPTPALEPLSRTTPTPTPTGSPSRVPARSSEEVGRRYGD